MDSNSLLIVIFFLYDLLCSMVLVLTDIVMIESYTGDILRIKRYCMFNGDKVVYEF